MLTKGERFWLQWWIYPVFARLYCKIDNHDIKATESKSLILDKSKTKLLYTGCDSFTLKCQQKKSNTSNTTFLQNKVWIA